jgi:hypothetical protein
MSIAIESDNLQQEGAAPIPAAAQELRSTMGAVRLAFTWMGTQRRLDANHARRAADTFQADESRVRASKILINTKHSAYRAATAIRAQAQAYLRGISLPYPQPSIRLIRRDDVETFESHMNSFRERLANAVANLRDHYEALKADARERLGELYNDNDYPATLDGVFSLTWEYPSVEPPRYLLRFNPELYAQEQARIQQRFEQAVVLAENAFAERLQELVSHLQERLNDSPDGQPKTFKATTIENFQTFYNEFKRLNVRGNTELDTLIQRANDLVSGVNVAELRGSARLRETLNTQMADVAQSLDRLMQNAPRRRVILD